FEEFLKRFKDISKDCEIVVASGSLPSGLPGNTYEVLIEIAKKNEAKFVLDTSGIYLEKALNAKPFMIKPNKEELEKLIEKSLNDVNEIK
ncbi:PfkB family carbohydrate kinase, partial [Thermovenabulum sp.]|uniref:PfkB family carbohydrate kinase n=1 Tax=Thermovenabulum sp. TaxID=3100335 RepID=UPI003C7CD3F8